MKNNKNVIEIDKNFSEFNLERYLDSEGTIFHNLKWLETIEEIGGLKLRFLVYTLKERYISVLPVFKKRVFGQNFIYSPPPHFGIPFLGPVLNKNHQKNYECEKDWKNIINGFSDFIKLNYDPLFTSILTTTSFADVRPFKWNKFIVKPYFTYFLNLSKDKESIFANFKKQMRTDIRRAVKYENIEIRRNNYQIFNDIILNNKKRYIEQEKEWKVSIEYLQKIFERFYNSLEIVAAYSENTFITGMVLLKDKGVVRHWIGGTKYSSKFIGINEFLHWEAIKKFKEERYSFYEFMGANTENLCIHKSKYNPYLESYYHVYKIKWLNNLLTLL